MTDDEVRIQIDENEFWLVSPSERAVRREEVSNSQRRSQLKTLANSPPPQLSDKMDSEMARHAYEYLESARQNARYYSAQKQMQKQMQLQMHQGAMQYAPPHGQRVMMVNPMGSVAQMPFYQQQQQYFQSMQMHNPQVIQGASPMGHYVSTANGAVPVASAQPLPANANGAHANVTHSQQQQMHQQQVQALQQLQQQQLAHAGQLPQQGSGVHVHAPKPLRPNGQQPQQAVAHPPLVAEGVESEAAPMKA